MRKREVANKYGEKGGEYADTIADDKALDLEAWQDAVTWQIKSPQRLIQIAYKIENGIVLSVAERKYLWKWRQREQKKLL